MPRKRGIVEGIEDAWQDLAVTFKHLFGRTKILNLPPCLESKIHDGLTMEKPLNNSTKCLDNPKVISLEEKIISRKTAAVHLAKLEFLLFSLSLTFEKSINYVNLLFTSKEKEYKLDITKTSVNNISIDDNLWCYCKKPIFLIKKRPFFSSLKLVEKEPLKAKKRSFQEVTPREIISFWQLLLAQTKVSRENLEFVGIYEPIPLHKVKEIKFNSRDNSVDLFLNSEKKITKNKPVRLLVAKDKKENKIYTVVTPI